MMFGQDRNQMRQVYYEAWEKYRNRQPMQPLEQLVADIIAMHPEYHGMLENPGSSQHQDYLPEDGESNPFLHMGLHIAIHEQLSTDRPAGIRPLYQQLLEKLQDAHAVEHRIMECLAESLWQAQQQGLPPDETAYLDCLRRL